MARDLYHLTVGDTPWCDWTGCKAGHDIAADTGVHACHYVGRKAADSAAKALRPRFKRGRVKVRPGACPSFKFG